ncbi:MAG: hypothetical protein LBD05_00450, partial [Mycoplasmataceae bacterium]|nr:hypothetical protein [Mycoplasmataceae bacterium]
MKKSIIILFLFFQAAASSAQEKWLAEIDLPQMGKYQFFTTQIKFSDNHFALKSTEDRDKLFMGSLKANFLRLVQKRKYKKSICIIDINNDSGIIHSLFGMFNLDSITLDNNAITAKVVFDEDQTKGSFFAKKLDGDIGKLNDYQLIFNNIQNKTKKEIFNLELTNSKKWKKFIMSVESKIEKVEDDLDFLLLFFVNARNVGFSHYAVMKENVNLERTLSDSQLESNILNDSILYVKIKSLSGTIREIDSIFQQSQHYKYKILDFRGTPGGV